MGQKTAARRRISAPGDSGAEMRPARAKEQVIALGHPQRGRRGAQSRYWSHSPDRICCSRSGRWLLGCLLCAPSIQHSRCQQFPVQLLCQKVVSLLTSVDRLSHSHSSTLASRSFGSSHHLPRQQVVSKSQ